MWFLLCFPMFFFPNLQRLTPKGKVLWSILSQTHSPPPLSSTFNVLFFFFFLISLLTSLSCDPRNDILHYLLKGTTRFFTSPSTRIQTLLKVTPEGRGRQSRGQGIHPDGKLWGLVYIKRGGWIWTRRTDLPLHTPSRCKRLVLRCRLVNL